MGTRERIIQAAARVIERDGLVGATTRQIAKAAGLSEGALYKHFASKGDLFLEVLKGSDSNYVSLVMALPARAGEGTVEGIVAEVAAAALAFYRRSIPMGGSLFSAPELLEQNRQLLRSRGAGPQNANLALTAYLRAEQELDRLPRAADPEAAANLLLGAIFQHAYLMAFLGMGTEPDEMRRFVDGTVKEFLRGLRAE